MSRLQEIAHRPASAAVGLAIGGLMWGLYWIPLRYLSGLGMDGAWPGAIVFLGAFVLLLPVVWRRRYGLRRNWWALLTCGLLTGAAFSLFSTAIMLTDVVRAILLFYITPVWSTILGYFWLGERLTAARLVALALGLVGMLIMLGLGAGWPIPRSLGDILALASGVVWAIGSLRLYQVRSIAVSEQVIAFVVGALAITFATIFLGGPMLSPLTSAAVLGNAIKPALIIALFVVPTLFLTIWPATTLPPARVGLILMTEIVAGVLSAAIWSGEVFGWREAIGSALIVGAGFVEVLGHRAPRSI